MLCWGDLFSSRQSLSLATLGHLARTAPVDSPPDLAVAIRTCLALAVDRLADFNASLCVLNSVGGRGVVHVFGRQALPMVWDFMETNPFNTEAANWRTCYEVVDEVINNEGANRHCGTVSRANAAQHPLPDDSAAAFVTDPPYYDAVPYADLSDFFYVWLRRNLPVEHESLVAPTLTEKEQECIVDPVRKKDREFFERNMWSAMSEGRRVLQPNGIGIVVFAHKSTAGWETQLQAMVDAGWIVTGSWPIDTERPGRLRAQGSAALASSVHLICRPRENTSGAVTEVVGEWRDVLGELPKRIHEWMPRLAAEGVVGADAIFACLGPALEIFSRFSRVEKSNGEPATLREFLEHVWAAVATEALSLIFKDANAAGLEPDARLTAMWLWTLGGASGNDKGSKGSTSDDGDTEATDERDDEESLSSSSKGKALGGFPLEYDAARKIAQGLGVHLEQCESLVEIKGDKARLLPVAERTVFLFGKGTQNINSSPSRRKKPKQKTLFGDLDEAEAAEAGWTDLKGPPPGTTILDRVHQSMILFAANRGELLKRFLVEEGVGKDERFWKLADNLNKLYPPGTDERRWIEGVLARKKGLGF
jgi:adenine-specific DNA methylase